MDHGVSSKGEFALGARDTPGSASQAAHAARLLDRVRLENAELRARIAELDDQLVESRSGLQEIDSAVRLGGPAQPELELEIVELRGMLAEAERQLGAIRQTFVYRIGDAIVSARTWKGVRSLPRRLLVLRRAFLEKRRTVQGAGLPGERLAEKLRYVEDAAAVLARRGLTAAAARVRSIPSRYGAEKARALAELAHAVRVERPDAATELGLEAAALNPRERRLRALILALFDQGEVDAPARLLGSIDPDIMASQADRRRAASIVGLQRQLANPVTFPPAPRGGLAGAPRLAVLCPRSAPHDVDALTCRAQCVIEAASRAGLEAVLVTAPGYHHAPTGDGSHLVLEFGSARTIRLARGAHEPEAFDLFVNETADTITSLLSRLNITHVHALDGFAFAAAGLTAARRLGARFVMDVSELPRFAPPTANGGVGCERDRAHISLLREICAQADQVIVRSREVSATLTGQTTSRKAILIEDAAPVDLARASAADIAKARQDLGLGAEPVIGVFEAVGGDPGLADALAAMATVLESEPGAKLVFWGDPRGARQVLQAAAREGVAGSVVVATMSMRERPAACVGAADVSLFLRYDPSADSAFAMQVALAVGAPVVAIASDLSREWIVDGVHGRAVARGDRAALAKAILMLLRDDRLAAAMTRAGAEAIANRGHALTARDHLIAAWRFDEGQAAA